MVFIVDIILPTEQTRSYKIDASSEEEALERLKLRLPPDIREEIKIDSITIDTSTIRNEDPFGIFNN